MKDVTSNTENKFQNLSKLLSPSTLDHMADKKNQQLSSYSRQLIESGMVKQKGETFQQGLDKCYSFFCKQYRNEYVYKNVLFNELILKNHSLKKCAVIPEFRVGRSKADLAIFNGTSTVYEIKTELDTLNRLPNQINDYSLLFDKIYVVTHSQFIDSVLSIVPEFVGVYVLNEKLKLDLYRAAKSNKKNVSNSIIMSSLRKNEYTSIVKEFYGATPDVPNTRYYNSCKELIMKINNSAVHDSMVKALLKRVLPENQVEIIKSMPYSLRALSLTKRFNEKQWSNICSHFMHVIN